MLVNHKTLMQAKAAGFRTFLAFWFTSALFAAPLLASHQNFAHSHPLGTKQHIHAVNAIFSSEAAASFTPGFNLFIVLYTLNFLSLDSFIKPLSLSANLTRAPPLE